MIGADGSCHGSTSGQAGGATATLILALRSTNRVRDPPYRCTQLINLRTNLMIHP
jgi:hypothetical protein